MRLIFSVLIGFALLCGGVFDVEPARAQDSGKPLIMPVAGEAGPSTWLLGQGYGNTVGAFLRGKDWYEAGQQLHFGIDLSMQCGTPLVAVADGTVGYVDDMGFGSGPHNLILNHPQLGLTTLYGHLLSTPTLEQGEQVKQGDVVGLSGDPDETCDSRPHLHFEVRSLNYLTTYNPVETIAANWHELTAIGSFSYPMFEQDLDNAAQWMRIDDQPDVNFWGRALNDYAAPYPDYRLGLPPENPPLARSVDALPEGWQMRRLTYENCCATTWWSVDNQLLTIDGAAGQRAGIFQWNTKTGELMNVIGTAPPPISSPDESLTVARVGGQIVIQRVADGSEWTVETQNTLPAISAGNSHLMWEVSRNTIEPGETQPKTEIWISDVDGANARAIAAEIGGYGRWLDDSRVLVGSRQKQRTTLAVYDTATGESFRLGTWDWLRNLSIAPGGGRIMFYVVFQDDPANDGIYVVETQAGAEPQHMPFFGAWRWRDGDSMFYVPFDPATAGQTLRYYDLVTRVDRAVVETPFLIANGIWSAAPDGDQIVFWNADDLSLWVIDGTG